MPKRQGIENKVSNNHTPELNMAYLVLCTCDRTPFLAKLGLYRRSSVTFYLFNIFRWRLLCVHFFISQSYIVVRMSTTCYGGKKLVTVGISAFQLYINFLCTGAIRSHLTNVKCLTKKKKSQKREDFHMYIKIIQI